MLRPDPIFHALTQCWPEMRKRMVILLLTCLVAIGAFFVWRTGFLLTLLLECHVVPEYSEKHASLRQALTYFKNELTRQSLRVQIQILDENGCDDLRVARGIGGNGYLCLHRISEIFETRIKWQGFHIVVSGVGSKRPGEMGLGP